MFDIDARVKTPALAFIFSFCSLSYQLILARAAAQIETNEILIFSLTIGFHLLTMGLGAFFSIRLRSTDHQKMTLFITEALLAALGAMAVTWITTWVTFSDLTSNILPFAKFFRFIGLIAPVILIGFFSGFEIPLLAELSPRVNMTKILMWNYLGAFFASVFIPIYGITWVALAPLCVVISLINIISNLLLLKREQISKNGIFIVSALFVVIGTQILVLRYSSKIEQVFLKNNYLELRLSSWSGSWEPWSKVLDGFEEIERVVSPYQTIDIIPANFMRGKSEGNFFAVYLNLQPQFSAENIDVYHESMAFAPASLIKKTPKSVLILGGGDGFLLKQILRMPFIEKIKLVEIDESMISLAKNHSSFLKYNEGSFFNPRVSLIIDDGFAWMKHQTEKWDIIYIDFPFPVNYEINKLYSVEFYQTIFQHLSEEGLFILDAPIWNSSTRDIGDKTPPQNILFSTIKEAGAKMIRLIGPFEPFLIASKNSIQSDFDETKWPVEISNKTSLNMTFLDQLERHIEYRKDYVNKIFQPRRMRW